MEYEKKPFIIEILKWTGKNHRSMWDFLTVDVSAYMETSGKNFEIDHSKVEGGLIIKGIEGDHIATIGDYIVKGIEGVFYPCNPDVFKTVLEAVDREHSKTHE